MLFRQFRLNSVVYIGLFTKPINPFQSVTLYECSVTPNKIFTDLMGDDCIYYIEDSYIILKISNKHNDLKEFRMKPDNIRAYTELISSGSESDSDWSNQTVEDRINRNDNSDSDSDPDPIYDHPKWKKI